MDYIFHTNNINVLWVVCFITIALKFHGAYIPQKYYRCYMISVFGFHKDNIDVPYSVFGSH